MDPNLPFPPFQTDSADSPDAAIPPERLLQRTGPRAMARIRFDLSFESPSARHTDTLVATRLNLWRDLLPPPLDAELVDRPRGYRCEHPFAPGELVGPWLEERLLPIEPERFDGSRGQADGILPQTGRFYPRSLVRGLDRFLRAEALPCRIVETAGERLLVDFNHPLAGLPLSLCATIESIWSPGDERGGRCTEVAELLTASGPGMQARWRGQPTDFWSDRPFERADERPDAEFYREPRLVDHLDRTAIAQIRALYGRLIPPGARILDLMSSWRSHLPESLAQGQVTGLGMSSAELDANPVLAERVVRDLNATLLLPFPDESFDAAVCTVSVEYLIQPFAVFREVARVLRPGGCFVVTFSDRRFPTKAIRIWDGLHPFERPGLVLEYFLESGRFRDLETWSLRGLPRPPDDKYADRLAQSDPIHGIWGWRTG